MDRSGHDEKSGRTSCGGRVEDESKADSFAKALGIPMAYGSYEDLLNDPNVEAIYTRCPITSMCL